MTCLGRIAFAAVIILPNWPPALAANTQLTAQASAGPLYWNLERVDAPKAFGLATDRALRFDAEGHPHIVYGGDFLYYAWYDGADWQYQTADYSRSTGEAASLALDDSGNPHIAYFDRLNQSLKYAHWNGSFWHTESLGVIGHYTLDPGSTSIAVDHQGHPHIAYRIGSSPYSLGYAVWTGSNWQFQLVDSVGGTGFNVSLALDSAGRPHIAYEATQVLKYAQWTGSTWIVQSLESGNTGYVPSLALDAFDQPHISYAGSSSSGIRYHYRDAGGWHFEDIGTGQFSGGNTSIALDAAGWPHISYQGDDASVRYAHWTGTNWDLQVVEPNAGNTLTPASLALDNEGNPGIVYTSYAGRGELHYAALTGDTWQSQKIDTTGRASHIALGLDEAGSPHLAYSTIWQVKYAWRVNGIWETEIVDTGGSYAFVALALDSLGQPHVVYSDLANDELWYAHLDGSVWVRQIVADNNSAGAHASIVLDAQDHAHISYHDAAQGALKYARWDGLSWQAETVDDAGNPGYLTSIALDLDGHPHISYLANLQESTDIGELRYAHWTGDHWEQETLTGGGNCLIEGATSLALDSHNRPHINYTNYLDDSVRYMHWTGSEWLSETLLTTGACTFGFTSLAVDHNDTPHIAYYDYFAATVKYAVPEGEDWSVNTVDASYNTGYFPSLAIEASGRVHLGYMDNLTGDVMYAEGGTSETQFYYLPMVLQNNSE